MGFGSRFIGFIFVGFRLFFIDFDYRFWFFFSWTPHGLSMAYLWSIYGGSQGELFFLVFFASFIWDLVYMGCFTSLNYYADYKINPIIAIHIGTSLLI
jgi:hypothetical protein